jgi:hypothetical protein
LEIHKKDFKGFTGLHKQMSQKKFSRSFDQTQNDELRVLPMRRLWNKIKCRKWKWIGHTLREGPTAIENQALNWNPQGQGRRGRPRMTWKRTVVEEAGKADKTWKEVTALAQN